MKGLEGERDNCANKSQCIPVKITCIYYSKVPLDVAVHVPLWRGFRGEDYTIKTNLNQPQIVRSQALRSRFFRLGWCGNDNPCLPTNFHSIRRSGGVYSIFIYCYLKVLMVSAKSLGLVAFFLQKKD